MKNHCVASAFFMTAFLLSVVGCGSRRVALAPDERDQLKNQPEIVAVHYQPNPHLPVKNLGGPITLYGRLSTSEMDLEDPLVMVKERFLQSVSQEFKLTNVRSIDQAFNLPLISRASGGTGFVFEFYPGADSWQLVFVRRALSAGKTTYGIDYTVGARLIRLDDGRILWFGDCFITRDKNPRTWDELTENDNTLLKKMRLVIVDECVAQLLNDFAGGTERSGKSGREEVQPKD